MLSQSCLIIVAADSCQSGIGGILLQRQANDTEKALFYMNKAIVFSKELQPNWEESFAPLKAVERSYKCMWGRHFILQTGHRPQLALYKSSKTKKLIETTAARLRRQAICFIGYNFDNIIGNIEYVKMTLVKLTDCFN